MAEVNAELDQFEEQQADIEGDVNRHVSEAHDQVTFYLDRSPTLLPEAVLRALNDQ